MEYSLDIKCVQHSHSLQSTLLFITQNDNMSQSIVFLAIKHFDCALILCVIEILIENHGIARVSASSEYVVISFNLLWLICSFSLSALYCK